MDTSEQYIKMCDCEEIQEYWGERSWDCSLVARREDHDISIYLSEYHRYRGENYYILLPRQDQLQEMGGLGWCEFDKRCIEREYVFSTTKEIAGIQVLMKEKHNKIWDGEKWIESTG